MTYIEAGSRQHLPQRVQRLLSATDNATRWVGLIGLTVAVAIAYFLAARLSLD
jgi:hypothetical protein